MGKIWEVSNDDDKNKEGRKQNEFVKIGKVRLREQEKLLKCVLERGRQPRMKEKE